MGAPADPPGAAVPAEVPAREDQGTGGTPQGPEEEDDCQRKVGSSVECTNMTLRESFPIAGTPFSLNYSSARQAGRSDRISLEIRLSTGTIPPSLKRIDLDVQIADRFFEYSFPPNPNQTFNFQFDGRDSFERQLQGRLPVRVQVDYAYDAFYGEVNRFGRSGTGRISLGDRARGNVPQSSLEYPKSGRGTVAQPGSEAGRWTCSTPTNLQAARFSLARATRSVPKATTRAEGSRT